MRTTTTDMKLKNFYLTIKEIEKMQGSSKKMGISVSEFLRRIIDNYYNNLEQNENSKII